MSLKLALNTKTANSTPRTLLSPQGLAYKEKYKVEFDLFLKNQKMKREFNQLRIRRSAQTRV